MPSIEEVRSWRGDTVVDRDGDKLGKVEDIYLDRQTDEPEWVAVKTGLVGSKLSFIPLAGARCTSPRAPPSGGLRRRPRAAPRSSRRDKRRGPGESLSYRVAFGWRTLHPCTESSSLNEGRSTGFVADV